MKAKTARVAKRMAAKDFIFVCCCWYRQGSDYLSVFVKKMNKEREKKRRTGYLLPSFICDDIAGTHLGEYNSEEGLLVCSCSVCATLRDSIV